MELKYSGHIALLDLLLEKNIKFFFKLKIFKKSNIKKKYDSLTRSLTKKIKSEKINKHHGNEKNVTPNSENESFTFNFF